MQKATARRLWLPVLLILLGVWVRGPLLWQERPFHVDEALYATFARQISHENNPLLIGSPVDKPPLTFYLTAFSFKLFTEPSAWAARIPNFIASILSLAALWASASRLYRDQAVAALAVLFLALSVSDATLAGTAFTDPQATWWVLLACLAATKRRWGWAGLCAGLAFACKQSAAQFWPLIVVVGSVEIQQVRTLPHALLRFTLPLLIVIGLLFIWGAARGPDAADWWALGTANNAPDRLIRSDEVAPRLTTWLGFVGENTGGPVGLIGLCGIGSAALATRIVRAPHRCSTTVDVLLATYTLGYLLIYWLAAFNVYDRYLHTLMPLIGLLIARGIDGLSRLFPAEHRTRMLLILTGALIVVIGPAALSVHAGNTSLQDEYEPYTGIADVAAYLNALPPGTIVYDHWLGWQLGWYTGQHRPRDMWLRLTYYPTPEALATDARRQADPQSRYFVAPDWVWAGPWLAALDEAGFAPQREAQFGHFTVYRLTPP